MDLETQFVAGAITLLVLQCIWNVFLLRGIIKHNGFLMSYKKVILIMFLYSVAILALPPLASTLVSSEYGIILGLIGAVGLFYAFFFLSYKEITFLRTTKIWALYTGISIIIGLCVTFLLLPFTNSYTPFMVSGKAMTPAYTPNEYLLVQKIDNDYLRGDVVVYTVRENHFIGRIVGLPNETIRISDGNVFANEKELTEPYVIGKTFSATSTVQLSTNEFFIMGDNREASADSRVRGPVHVDQLIGEIATRIDLLSF